MFSARIESTALHNNIALAKPVGTARFGLKNSKKNLVPHNLQNRVSIFYIHVRGI